MTTTTDRTAETADVGEARWIRPLVAIAAVLSLLLLGAAGGLLLGLPGSTRPEPGPVDIGFNQDMTVHHLQAVEMAGWERDHTTDPVLAQLATDIERTQNNQIGQMQGWLALWEAPALPLGGHMGWMADAPGAHDHTGPPDPATGAVARMPGMASSAELQAMRAATGPELDVVFLQLMLRHHQGGADMLVYASEHAAVPQVRTLAAQMLRAQASETAYLQQLLHERGGTPLPL
ncbi:DUF305 domain-containing protein [Pseudonocardia sp.]|uniref:DUF305 domain-containing protein n=1 Tax=Pseudonocardia sp. TaxID=60912 RepID=UPI0026133356|nr:DUF305 domain-containing protein [Pseudonocardia sp.]